MGIQTFVENPQIAIPQCMGIIPLSQFFKFIRITSQELQVNNFFSYTANPQISLIFNPLLQIRNFLQ